MIKTNSTMSVTVKVSRPRTFAKPSVSEIKKKVKKNASKVVTKPSEATLRIYSVPTNIPLQANAIKKDVSLLPYRLFEKKQERNKDKQRIGIKVQERYKLKSTDLRNRLHIPNPPNDVIAVTDIDESYFRFLENKPANQYIPKYKSLRFQYHERLILRQEIGYKKDCVLNIEENYRREQQKYERCVERYLDQVKQFNDYVAEDYLKSMECLKKCDVVEKKLNAELVMRETLANNQFAIQSRLIGLDYLYFIQQKYGRFLYYLSPPSWRSKNREFAHSVEIEAKGFDLGSSSEEDTFNVVFQNMQNECNMGLVKPVIYFSDPDMLMSLFDRIEKQHFNHFIHVIPLTPHRRELKKCIAQIKWTIEKDTALVSLLIQDFIQHVNFCEEREAQLQAKFMKILNGLFYDTVAAADVLKLKMNLEFYYEQLNREESFNMNSVLTAKSLEASYFDYSFKLDAFTNDSVKEAMQRCIDKEAKKFKRAHNAARELRMFYRLEQSLLRAFDKKSCNVKPSIIDMRKQSTFKQNIFKRRQSMKPVIRLSNQQYSLTEAEIEYLRLFTDWTENEDPAKYLHRVSVSDRNNSASK